ncbi:MAG: P1 family peptidase [Tabrizicola sp.]|uniref:P1 family peptidase n=1 Tax=Tabrizicola sp. TaxID=2005166 RepID=UPI002736197C|nr:P1 family peptidase [Tabrizicola sp.]MDP3262261.1 P1 family peptidase [Tabrizicola sp.]MDP3647992.1 P1 family peptidase [Paracoccaceae bacterium]MDZ4065417.1 P1 family peptidase [Tabrizicola sp.]
MRPGLRNLITDVPGLRVGHAQDLSLRSGCTVLTADAPFTAAVHIMGGAPGTRETDLLAPDRLVQKADALVLSGGSAFGLDAASGAADALRALDRGFPVGPVRVPIVPAAILFDLLNGGDKAWDRNPYHALGRAALTAALTAAATDFALGTAGAGFGATTDRLKGGLGSASAILPSGITVGALVAVNSLGSVTVGDGPHFWAAPWEEGAEFGGLGPAPTYPRADAPQPTKRRGEATTIAIVATDAALTRPQAQRMATAAHDGMARAILPSHTLLDGDLVFAAATGARPLSDEATDSFQIGHAAATCLARAIARAVFMASAAEGDLQPTYHARFGRRG